jgi:hypothetical protein
LICLQGFAGTDDVEADLVGVLDLFDEMPEARCRLTARLFWSNAAVKLSIPIPMAGFPFIGCSSRYQRSERDR